MRERVRRCGAQMFATVDGGANGGGEAHTKTTPNRVVPVQQEPRAIVCGFAVQYKRFHGLIIIHIIILQRHTIYRALSPSPRDGLF